MCQSCPAVNWEDRELDRFNSGHYKRIPEIAALNGSGYPAKHYVHLSVQENESDFVAYTPSAEYGERDRQVRLKYGKYLRKAFEDLSDSAIQAAVTELRAKLAIIDSAPVLKFATTRETINEIFETNMGACSSGGESCMYGKFNDWPIRPYHVYADSPDVAVAYLIRDGEIIARSVVSTKDKKWVRLYAIEGGDNTICGILEELLTSAGYSEGDLYGCRLTKLKTPKPMLPYIDNGGCQVSDIGDYWKVVERDGDWEASCTDGSADACSPMRSGCGEPEDECSCVYCECCEERFPDGCGDCSFCPSCDRCTEHYNCSCNRCGDCNELIERSRYNSWTVCDCLRCEECNELTNDCDCDYCEECQELETNCECEEEDDSTDTENATTV